MYKPLHRLQHYCLIGILLVAAIAGSISPVTAHQIPGGHDCTSCHTLSRQEATELLSPLNLTVKSLRPSPVTGLFEVIAEKSGQEGIIYIDYGKKLLMQGVIVNAGQVRSSASPTGQQPADGKAKP